MKTVKTTVSSNEIASYIDLELPGSMTASQTRKIKDEVGELLIDHILLNVGKGRSPFGAGAFPPLSKKYKSFKLDEGSEPKPNLELSGEMLDSLSFSHIDIGIKIFVSGEEALRADGHNNFSGDSRIPTRQFLPKKDDSFGSMIEREVSNIISENAIDSSSISRADIAKITTKTQLNDFLREAFPLVSVRQAKSAILVDDNLRTLFAAALVLF